jgi:hypothetical protein
MTKLSVIGMKKKNMKTNEVRVSISERLSLLLLNMLRLFAKSQFDERHLAKKTMGTLLMQAFADYLFTTLIRETLQKGKVHYSFLPYANLFRSVAFDIAIIIYFLTKQATFMKRLTVLSLPL